MRQLKGLQKKGYLYNYIDSIPPVGRAADYGLRSHSLKGV